MRLIKIFFGLLFFISAFTFGVLIRDALYDVWIKKTIERVQPGMTAKEVVTILGNPTSRHMSDIQGEYWCWGSDSFSDKPEYCGNVALEMGPSGIVERVLPVIP